MTMRVVYRGKRKSGMQFEGFGASWPFSSKKNSKNSLGENAPTKQIGTEKAAKAAFRSLFDMIHDSLDQVKGQKIARITF